jgi:biopolymer transport protein ExbD
MRFKRRVTIVSGGIELTPLVDMVLLLLIFFVLSSRYITEPGIKVEVPESAASTSVEASDLVVTITDKNEVYFGSSLVSPLEDYEALRIELRKIRQTNAEETPRLIVNADEKVAWGRVFQIMDIAWAEGFPAQLVGVRPKEP